MNHRHLFSPPPLRPFTLAEHQDRWRAVAGRYFTMAELKAAQSAGMPPEHVFDFESGVRLIISNEDHGGGCLYAHCSASPLMPIERTFAEVYQAFGFGLTWRRWESLSLGAAEAITGIPFARWRSPMLSARKAVPNWFARIGS